MSSNNSNELDTFVLRSYGRCEAYNVNLDLPLSRLCPLAYQIVSLRRDRQAPPPFLCKDYSEHHCPLAERIETLALEEAARLENPQTLEDIQRIMRPHNQQSKDYVNWWLSVTPECDLPNVGRMVAQAIKATDSDEEYKKFVRSFPHDNQLCLWELLKQRE